MVKIIPTTKVQQQIGSISAYIGSTAYIVTNRGEGRIIMLPYFDGCDEWMADYMEDYEMAMNREALEKKYKESLKSGESDLVI